MSTFKLNNQIVSYRNSEQTVLEALEENGFYIPSSCLSGGGHSKLVEQGLTADQSFEIVWSPPIVNKSRVLSLHKEGLSQSAIARELKCSRFSIAKVLRAENDLKT